MLKRITTGAGAVAALCALALGGSAFASGSSVRTLHHHAAIERTTTKDADNVQSGDQTTPDTGAQASGAAESGTETNSETSGPSDGPGGHQDPAGANVDHQFQGQE